MSRVHRPGIVILLAVLAAGGCSPENRDRSLVEAGRRIYEEGVLPNGDLLVATRPEGLVLEGRYAACATCHRHSGMGSVEGLTDQSILVPPIAGPVLFQDARFANSWLDESHHWVPHETWRRAMTRPAYDSASFAKSLRNGVNTLNQEMLAPMPLYALDDDSMTALIAYIERLSGQPDPGVESEQLHIATVVTPDVPSGDAEGVLGVLRGWSKSGMGAGVPWTLHEWRLTGPVDSWAGQLEVLYQSRPVFALLSGVGRNSWGPVHRFCEDQEIACIMPSIDVAPHKRGDRYSMYFSPGVGLEARILADVLKEGDLPERIVQIVADDTGRFAAETLSEEIQEQDVSVLTLDIETVEQGLLERDLSDNDVIVAWLRPKAIGDLVGVFPEGLPVSEVFLAGLLATPSDLSLPSSWRRQSRFVTLFDDLGLQGEIARLRLEQWLKRNQIPIDSNRRMQADAYAACHLFNKALSEIRKQEVRRPSVPLTRNHVIETLEDLVAKYSDGTQLVDEDSHVAFYGRMSLGPGQRIATRGGSILRYASPNSDSGRLVPVSGHIVP